MEFIESAVEQLNTKRPDDVMQLLSRLCGQTVDLRCPSIPHDQGRCGRCLSCHNNALLTTLCREDRWNLATLNQALLLLKQPTVSRGFYAQFFGGANGGEGLKRGVVRFRGMAMLRFGNFRFAFKSLCSKGRQELLRELAPYSILPQQFSEYYRERPRAVPLVRNIDRSKKWLLGYISGPLSEQDILTLTGLQLSLGGPEDKARQLVSTLEDGWKKLEARRRQLTGVDPKPWEPKLQEMGRAVTQIRKEGDEARAIGASNTSAYLGSEHLDVYVATSMRERWEYEDTSKFLERVFSHQAVRDLGLVYFDPTLSYCKDRIDKGLIEGLMLKRARCTIYMVQETDTLGKDSELASTLAQGKPVIAYVPRESADEIRKRLAEAGSLRFITKRLLLLMAELELSTDVRKKMAAFLSKAAEFNPLFRLVGTEESEFRARFAEEWREMEGILATAEAQYFEKRASTLKKSHPLALQVHLETGVANGVLVTHSAEECAQLLAALLANQCSFTIEHEQDVYVLRESISKCPFRVVTDDPMLTNSFWDFYGRGSPVEAMPEVVGTATDKVGDA